MATQWNPLIIPLIIIGLSSSYFALRKLTEFQTPGRKVVAASLVCSAVWSLGYAFVLASTQSDWMFFWNKIQQVGVGTIPLLYLYYVVLIYGKSNWLKTRNIILALIIPITVLILSMIEHSLSSESYSITLINGHLFLIQDYGPAFWIYLTYSFLLVFTALVILVFSMVRSIFSFRGHITILMFIGLFPVLVALGEFLSLSPVRHISLTGFAAALSTLLLGLNLDNINTADLATVSRGLLPEYWSDGIIIIDKNEQIVHINEQAHKIIKFSPKKKKKKQTISEAWFLWENIKRTGGGTTIKTEDPLQKSLNRFVEVRIKDLADWQNKNLGQIIILSDITHYQQRMDEMSTLLELSNAMSDTLELKHILLNLTDKLLLVSGMDECSIIEFDFEKGESHYLAEISRSVWINSEFDDIYKLADYPSTKKVLDTGETVIVRRNDDDPEKVWLEEMNLGLVLMLPLKYENEVIGLVEVCAIDENIPISDQSVKHIQNILDRAGNSITLPIENSNEDEIKELSRSIIHSSWADSCSISIWDKELDNIRTISDYSEMLWSLGDGPLFRVEDWPAFDIALTTKKWGITRINDSDLSDDDREDLVIYGAKMGILIPISIHGVPIGGIELLHMTEEREISEDELRLWQALADQAAVMIQNAKLYEKARSELKQREITEERLSYEVYHDSLTGLANRALLMDRLGHALLRRKRSPDNSFAVLYMDLDNFKNINDNYGHNAGDSLLREVSTRILNRIRDCDTLARLGGDEFVILVDGFSSEHQVTRIAERIQESFTMPFSIQGHECLTNISTGIVFGDDLYLEPAEIIRDADIAMYRAKNQGKACFEIFNVKMRTRILKRLQIEEDLRNALENEDFTLNFQPIVGFVKENIVSFETLIRWSLNGENIPPGEFIPIAEETGMIVPIGEWVLNTVCKQLNNWQQDNPYWKNIPVSVNISRVQLFNPHFINRVEYYLEQHSISGDQICLEITEGSIIDDFNAAIHKLSILRDLGIKILLDDFGKGYSSLSYISRLPFDIVKIDKFFISQLTDMKCQSLVKFIVDMAHDMDVKVIAEGVETPEQREYLISINCDFVQGYLISKPLDSLDFSSFVENKHGDDQRSEIY